MKRALLPVALAGVLALGAAGGGSAGASSGPTAADTEAKALAAACQSVRYGGRTYVMYRQRVRCRFARRWVRRLHRSEGDREPRGWTCDSGSNFRTGGGCVKGQRAFGWHPGD